MKKENLQKLTVSAMMISLSTVLSLFKIWEMPLGGSITPLSMLPVCLISLLYGTKYAIAPCFLYGVIQMAISGVFGWGLTPATLIGAIIFDYLAAFTVLCLSGVFRKKGEKGIIAGIAVACVARFVCHFISGCVFFQSFDVFNNPYIYSLCYNGFYMLPEMILTMVGIFLLCRVKSFKNLIYREI